MKWYHHAIGAAGITAMILGTLLMTYGLQPDPRPVTGPLPRDVNACLKAGLKFVIDFKSLTSPR